MDPETPFLVSLSFDMKHLQFKVLGGTLLTQEAKSLNHIEYFGFRNSSAYKRPFKHVVVLYISHEKSKLLIPNQNWSQTYEIMELIL